MKQILIIAVLTAAIAVVTCDDADWGQRQHGDFLLHSQTYTRSAQTLKVVKITVQYNGSHTITMIRAIDNSNGGTPKLVSGGPDSTTATIDLKSRRGKGLDYKIEFYGK